MVKVGVPVFNTAVAVFVALIVAVSCAVAAGLCGLVGDFFAQEINIIAAITHPIIKDLFAIFSLPPV
jgi:uncharacterized membrane protein YgaE (UPF0421/DUF939 family)